MARFTFLNGDDAWCVDNDNCFEEQSEHYCGPAVDRLAYYEDMEEQGRLVVLPAKQRSSVWLTEWWKNGFEWEKLSTPIERHIIYFSVEVGGVYAHFKEGSLHTKYFGKVAFLTREEAEQALKGGAE